MTSEQALSLAKSFKYLEDYEIGIRLINIYYDAQREAIKEFAKGIVV